ncbi:MAG: choice-of-anchor J domain-containing protein, partial [Bacteroidales bacterium]|nr:choice-of-anchor J domain-containing protein [Candidatus Scybalousia scybalohippi]
MKKTGIVFLLAILFSFIGFAQGPTLNEGFEDAEFPPEGWTMLGSGTSWVRSTSYQNSGSASAYVQDTYAGADTWLITPPLLPQDGDVVSFYVYPTYPNYASSTTFTVEVSTTTPEIAEFTAVHTVAWVNGFNQVTVDLSDYAGETIYVAFHVVDDYGTGTVIDDITGPEMVVAACTKSKSLAVSNLATDGATLSWTDDSQAGAYNIQYMLASETNWDNAELVVANDVTYDLTGLLSSNAYKVRVQTDCGSEQAEWSSVVVFATLCEAVESDNLPWTDNFDAMDELGCWTAMSTSQVEDGYDPVTYASIYVTTPGVSSSLSNSGAHSMVLGGTNACLVAGPTINEDIHNLRIKFRVSTNDYYGGSDAGTFEVGYVTDLTDPTSFVAIPTTIDVQYYEFSDPIVVSYQNIEAEEAWAAFRVSGATYNRYSYYVDDVEISLLPNCTGPVSSSIVASEITDNSMVIDWVDENGDNSLWNVYYKTSDAEEYEVVEATEHPITLENLNPSTSYSIYVATNCGGEESADVTNTISPSTLGLPLESLPYEQDFENPEEITEFTITGSGANQWAIGSATFNAGETGEESGNALYISNDNGVSNAYSNSNTSISYATLIVPFEEQLEYHLSFDFKCVAESGNYDYLKVFMLDATQDLSTSSLPSSGAITPNMNMTSNWTHYDYTLSGIQAGDLKQLVFAWKNDGTMGDNPPAAVDNISIYGNACAVPTNIVRGAADESSMTVAWTESGTATSWNVYYRIHGSEDEYESLQASDEPTLVIENLLANTAYDVYVEADCGGEPSTPSEVVVLRSGCGTITELPWEENFDSYEGSGVVELQCWNVVTSATANNGTFPAVYAGHAPACHSGANSMELKGGNILLGLPTFEESIENLRLSFYANTTASSASYAGTLEVGVLTDQADPASFVVLDTVTGEAFNRNGSNYVGPYDFNTLEEDLSTAVIALRYTSYSSSTSWNLDDFTVTPIPDCPAPNTPVATDIFAHSATISWTDDDDSHDAWTVYYKVASEEEYLSVEAAEPTVELTDLEASSTYQVYVMTNCGNEDNVDHTQTITFATACEAIEELPWNEGFESAVALPLCWTVTANNIEVSNSTSYAGPQTGSNSLRWKYGTDGFAFTPKFALTAGTPYIFRFNYRADGYSGWSNIYAAPFVDQNANAMVEGFEPEVIASYSSTSYTEYELNFTPEEDGEYTFGIHVTGNSSPWYFAVDNVSLQENNATCLAPVKNSVQVAATSTTAIVSFTDANEANTSWNLYYKSTEDEDWTIETINAAEYTLTDLTPSTTYQVYVRTNCGGDDESDSTYAVTFTTDCATFTDFPYVMNFDNGVDCWTSQLVYGSNHWGLSSSESVSGSYSARFTYDPESSARLISPVFDITSLQNPTLAYAYFTNPWYGDADSKDVYYRTSADDEWVFLAGYSDGAMTDFAFDTIALPNASAEYQVMFLGVGMDGNGVYLDDVTIFDAEGGEQPEVVAPQVATLAATQVAQTSAVLNGTITPGTETISAQGFEYKEATAANYTTVSATGNTMTATLNNLTANTTYEYRAYATTATSTYYGSAITFTTLEEQGGEPCTPTSSTTEATICEGSSYTFNGQTYTTAGT